MISAMIQSLNPFGCTSALFRGAPVPDSTKIDRDVSVAPHFLKTENLHASIDGREVFIKRIFSTEHLDKNLPPVIMAPGLSSNGNIFRVTVDGKVLEIDNDLSYANHLAGKGHDVYIAHFSYSSRVFRRFVARYCPGSKHFNNKIPYNFPDHISFDSLIEEEVPVLINKVLERSGKKQVFWIGHSMGAMLMYAYLAKTKDPRIKGVAAIGGPVTFSQTAIKLIGYANRAANLLGLEETNPVSVVSKNIVPLSNIVSRTPGKVLKWTPGIDVLLNPQNVSSNAIKMLFKRVAEPIPAGIKRSFFRWIRTGKFDYFDKMSEIETPFLFIGGLDDQLATPDSVRLAHERIAADKNDFYLLEGFGHEDLIFGKRAPEEVWKRTDAWMRRVIVAEG
jgi:pimeloyl-ACP methyl ester carboxylesterase